MHQVNHRLRNHGSPQPTCSRVAEIPRRPENGKVLPEPARDLLAAQTGVITRGQLESLGASPSDLARWRRRRELVAVHPGVYVDHSGEPTWLQRAWAAVLYLAPAALCHESALRIADGPGRLQARREPLIHVVVAESRRLVAPAGIRIHRCRAFDQQILWNLSPPRQRYEDAALDVALDAPDELTAIATLATGVQGRRTTASRLLEASQARRRVSRRSWLEAVLADVADGTCSVLEHGYLTRVERPHGLPRARRQQGVTTTAGRVYRDADYGRLLVELDGRLHHDGTQARDRDFDRDLDAALLGHDTVRLSWGQVFDRPCSTAGKIANLLAQRGWTGDLTTCGPACGLRAPRLARAEVLTPTTGQDRLDERTA